MALERNNKKLGIGLQCALGYLNLGMPEETLRELRELSPEEQQLPEVISLQAQACLLQGNWEDVVVLAEKGQTQYPEMLDFYVQGALAYEQMGEVQRAISLWKTAPATVTENGFYHYLVARCEVQLGNTSAARLHLQQALKLEPTLKQQMQQDDWLREVSLS